MTFSGATDLGAVHLDALHAGPPRLVRTPHRTGVPPGRRIRGVDRGAAPLIQRFGLPQVIAFGMALMVLAYGLLLHIGLDSSYWTVLFPTFALVGFGFGFAYGPLNIAATNGVSASERGLASGMVQTSFQFGGALALAITTAVNSAAVGVSRTPGAASRRVPDGPDCPGDRRGARPRHHAVQRAHRSPHPGSRNSVENDDDSESDRRCRLRRLGRSTTRDWRCRSACWPAPCRRRPRLGAGRERRGAIRVLRRRRQRRDSTT